MEIKYIVSPEIENTFGPINEDDAIAIHLLLSIQRRCHNCGTYDTPLWRRAHFDKILNREVIACNACSLRFEKTLYCFYCKYIYKLKEIDSRRWWQCSICRNRVHKKCKRLYGSIAFRCPFCFK